MIQQHMFEPMFVVPIKKIRPEVSPTAFLSGERTDNNGLRTVQHKPQFQCRDQSGIKHLPFILNGEVRPTCLECGDMVKLSLIHISEPTRRTPISYAVFCLKKK